MTAPAVLAERAAQIVLQACRLDVQAFKPGNVSAGSPGHGMTAQQFISSAEAMTPALISPDASVGARILGAVRASRAAAGVNTNLGIVLLVAPLVHAALSPAESPDLRQRVGQVLAHLDVADARAAYAAIRLASPGGLGRSARHDVYAEPDVTLLEAMREAGQRDRIAYQYASGFDDIFTIAIPALAAARARGWSDEWTAVAVFLRLLGAIPDTHIARKFGVEAARGISARAAELQCVFAAEASQPALHAFDTELKSGGLNPGTTADLTVGALVAAGLQEMLNEEAIGPARESGTGPCRNSGGRPMRPLVRIHQP